MPALLSLAMLLLAAIPSPSAVPAGGDIETSALAPSRLEIVVVEEPNCLCFSLFRRDLFPAYAGSPARCPCAFSIRASWSRAGSA